MVTIWVINKSKFVVPKYNLVKNTEPKLMELIMLSKFEYANLKTKNFRLKKF